MTAFSRDSSAPATRWILGAILVFGTVSRLLYLYAYRFDPFSSYLLHDARRYHEWAATLVSGRAWETGAFYQAPLYPYLVAAVYGVAGARPVAVYVVQALLGVLTMLLVFRVARRAYGETAGLAAAGLAALYGPLVFYETKLLPASLTVFLASVLLDRMQAADASRTAPSWLGAGIALGAAALAAPGLMLMALFGTVWIALDRSRSLRRRVLRIAWFGMGVALLVVPVTIRNYRASGDWVPISANGGITFYHGNNPNALGVFSVPPGLSASIFEQREECRRVAEQESGRSLSDGEISDFFFGKGLAFLGEDPLRSARLFAGKFLFALANEEQPLEYNVRLDENPFRRLFPLPFAAILALAVIRVHSGRRKTGTGRAEHPLLLLVLVQGITLLAFYVSGRYRLPAIPALAAIAGCGASVLADRLRVGTRSAATALATAALAAAFSLAYVPLFRGELRDQQTAMSYLDRSSALRNVGRRDDAIEAMQRSLELDPTFARRHLSLARALYESGRSVEAERSVREALRRDPSDAEAHFMLGVISVEDGRLEEAASAFSEVLRRDPTSTTAANNLLGLLIHLDQRARASELWQEMKTRGLSIDPALDETMRARSGE